MNKTPYIPKLIKASIYYICMLFLLSSCGNDENASLLPNKPVQLTISLGDARYTTLNNLGGFYSFTSTTGLSAYTYLGNGGILLVHNIISDSSYPSYAAYDLYCTYEKNVRIEPQAGGLTAICPKCGSIYDISSGIGNCTNGPAKQLRVYKAYYSASQNQITVTK